MSDKKPFASFEGEDSEQTAAYIAGLETDLAGRKSRGDDTKDVVAELKRMGVSESDAAKHVKDAAAERAAAAKAATEALDPNLAAEARDAAKAAAEDAAKKEAAANDAAKEAAEKSAAAKEAATQERTAAKGQTRLRGSGAEKRT